MGLYLYESSRLETLWNLFLERCDTGINSVLDHQRIVVPGAGWQSWISTHYAEARDCFAGFEFMTLGQWAHAQYADLLPQGQLRFDEQQMMWVIARLFQEREPGEYPLVDRYMEGAVTTDIKRLLALARQLAHLFDRYHLYRPELIHTWNEEEPWPKTSEMPEHLDWQYDLWKKIRREHQIPGYLSVLNQIDPVTIQQPQTTHLWLTSAVAPIYLRLIPLLGQHMDIHIYALRTFESFMGGVVSSRVKDWILEQGGDISLLETMHPIATWGRRGIELQLELIDELETHVDAQPELDPLEETPGGTLLHQLQSQVRTGLWPEQMELEILEEDRSLSVHSCHSARREVQVLHQQLRDALERDHELKPEQILVVCPNLEEYAEHLDAVFQTSPEERIPMHIAGRSPRRTSPFVEAYFKLLDLLDSRFQRSRVMEVLALEPVHQSLGLDIQSCHQIEAWLHTAGLTWGSDALHREEMGLPGYELHAWRYTLDRLLMGYACRPGMEETHEGVFVLERAEGHFAVVLGRFSDFIERLIQWRHKIKVPGDASDWAVSFAQILDEFLSDTKMYAHREMIMEGIHQLTTMIQESKWDNQLSFRVFRDELKRIVDLSLGGHGYRIGGVTITDMTAMRSLPFKVIGILGMNDRGFPRADQRVSFDLMSIQHELGDRHLENEDRQLLLEALLAARDRVVITYQGQSVKDQSHRPACVMIEDLKDYLAKALSPDAYQRVVLTHPLQSFSRRYFDQSSDNLMNYSVTDYETAKTLVNEPVATPVFADAQPSSLEEDRVITLRELYLLFEAPWQLYLSQMNLWLSDWYESREDLDPIELNDLEKWSLGQELLQAILDGEELELAKERLVLSGRLPAGELGRQLLEEPEQDLLSIKEVLEHLVEELDFHRQTIELEIDDILLSGEIQGVHAQTLIKASYSQSPGKHLIKLWVDHVLRCAMGEATPSYLVYRSKSGARHCGFEVMGADQAMSQLKQWIALCELAKTYPLPFFYQCAEIYLKSIGKGEAVDMACQKAEAHFYTSSYMSGKAPCDDPSVLTAFRGVSPFDLSAAELPAFQTEEWPEGITLEGNLFEALSWALYQPLLNAVREGE